MNDEFFRYYELLGVSPGASAEELKTAHRDMAKVWHPDRFTHDPRLQQKAQEKLKEINEAYEQLKAGKTGRRTPAPSPTNQSSTPPRASARRVSWKFILLPALAFVLIFFAAFRAFIPTDKQRTQSTTAPAEQAQALPSEEQQTPSDSSVRLPASESTRGKRADEQPARAARPSSDAVFDEAKREVRPLPTVTVTIDPVSGGLATPDCPTRSRMTYPAGSEPHAYCNLSHKNAAPEKETEQVRPKESRLKSFAKRITGIKN